MVRQVPAWAPNAGWSAAGVGCISTYPSLTQWSAEIPCFLCLARLA